LFTPKKEYGFALVYFTGSDKFNVDMRKHALTRGWSLNEHGFTYVGTDKKDPPTLQNEEEIFAFLEVPWIPPTQRTVYSKSLFDQKFS